MLRKERENLKIGKDRYKTRNSETHNMLTGSVYNNFGATTKQSYKNTLCLGRLCFNSAEEH